MQVRSRIALRLLIGALTLYAGAAQAKVVWSTNADRDMLGLYDKKFGNEFLTIIFDCREGKLTASFDVNKLKNTATVTLKNAQNSVSFTGKPELNELDEAYWLSVTLSKSHPVFDMLATGAPLRMTTSEPRTMNLNYPGLKTSFNKFRMKCLQ
jgi:hypothetical protein